MLQDTFVFGGSRHCLPLSDLPPAQPSHRAVRSSLSGSFFATSSHELSPGHVNSSRPPHAQHSPGHVSLRPQQHSLGHVFDLSHRVDAQAPEIGRNQGALVNKSAYIWNFDFFPFFGKECCLHFFVLGVNESAYISIQKGDCLHFDFLFLSVNNTAYIWNFDFFIFSVKNIAYIFVLWGKWKCLHFHPKRRLPTFQFFVSVGKQYCLHFHFCFFLRKGKCLHFSCLVFLFFFGKGKCLHFDFGLLKKNDDCFRFRFWVVVNDTAGLFLVQDNYMTGYDTAIFSTTRSEEPWSSKIGWPFSVVVDYW